MPNRMSRRELALGALASSALQGQAQGQNPPFSGPGLDPVAWTLERYREMPLRLTFQSSTKKQAEAWQKLLRAKITELLGGFPAKRTPLEAHIVDTRDFPNYRREQVIFTSRPGLAVAGYLLTPKAGKGPHPVMICVPGHGAGVDELTGIDEKRGDRTSKSGYQHDFAIQVVEQGVAAFAMEPMAFGCRRDARTAEKGLGNSACQPTAGAALLFGETMIGWRVYDVMRTIDWIATRPDLDSFRVGCMGISGGGTCTVFAAALEPRIRVSLLSCSLNTFRDSILSLSHCIDNYVPGILQWAEMYDVAGLIAPRALFVESGTKDPIFPIAASRASYDKVRKVYEVMGARGAIGQEIFDDDHVFHGVQGIPFVVSHLRA
jgi:dienelactone hydrolase